MQSESRTFNAEKPPKKAVFQRKVVGVQGLEPWASCSQSRRATNCATPRYEVRRSGWAYSPKPMSELSARGLAPSLALSGTPAVPLWNSIGLFISGTAFGFWDLCGIEFCILKVLPTGFTSNSGCFLPQRAAQKLRRINKEISAMTKKQQADLDDSQPAERRCLFDVLPFGSNTCSFA